MTTRDEIIELARECGIKNRVFPQSEVWGYERNIEAFYKAAQRQAYERAVQVCEEKKSNWNYCADAISALIERDGK